MDLIYIRQVVVIFEVKEHSDSHTHELEFPENDPLVHDFVKN